MPTWNETPHAVPAINVNLTPCDCGFAESERNAARGVRWEVDEEVRP